jgi:hypothetical protein
VEEDNAVMIGVNELLNLLSAKLGRFVLDIAEDELPIKEGDDGCGHVRKRRILPRQSDGGADEGP